MAQETNQTQVPLCAMGCGFYGNPRTNNMCSVCYKDFLQRQNSSGRVSPAVSSGVRSLGETLPTQCSESSTVDVPSAAALEHSSFASSQTLLSQAAITHSEEEDSAGAEVGVKTAEDSQERASGSKAIGRTPKKNVVDQLSMAGSSGASGPVRTASEEESARRGKRKLDETLTPVDGQCGSVSDDSDQTSVDGQDSSDKPKPKKSRCFMCRKKVGLTGFDCRCGNVFCGIHRYSDLHNCTFDYKGDAAEKIRKENPVIVGEKIQKI